MRKATSLTEITLVFALICIIGFYAINTIRVVSKYPQCIFSRDPILCAAVIEK